MKKFLKREKSTQYIKSVQLLAVIQIFIIWSLFYSHSFILLITNLQNLVTCFTLISDQEKCKKCDKSLLRLEEIDDDADQKGIGFVKILDPNLAFEYGLEELPALVYYRHKIPIVYDGKTFF